MLDGNRKKIFIVADLVLTFLIAAFVGYVFGYLSGEFNFSSSQNIIATIVVVIIISTTTHIVRLMLMRLMRLKINDKKKKK